MVKGWVSKNYIDIKQIYQDRSRGWPFSTFRLEGDYEFRTTGKSRQETNLFLPGDPKPDLLEYPYLFLNDRDLFGKSGAVKLEVAPNWRVELLVVTDNNNYWEDNSDLEYYTFRPALLNRQDAFIATLDGNTGDYLSIDIDQEFSGINNFSLFVDGYARHNSSRKDIDDEVRIAILSVQHYEELPDEVQGPLEEGGTGDIDNDGVIDSEDEDPYDPDIQQPGDTDDDVTPSEEDLTEEQQGEQPGPEDDGGNGDGDGETTTTTDEGEATLLDYLLLAAIVGIALIAIMGFRME